MPVKCTQLVWAACNCLPFKKCQITYEWRHPVASHVIIRFEILSGREQAVQHVASTACIQSQFFWESHIAWQPRPGSDIWIDPLPVLPMNMTSDEELASKKAGYTFFSRMLLAHTSAAVRQVPAVLPWWLFTKFHTDLLSWALAPYGAGLYCQWTLWTIPEFYRFPGSNCRYRVSPRTCIALYTIRKFDFACCSTDLQQRKREEYYNFVVERIRCVDGSYDLVWGHKLQRLGKISYLEVCFFLICATHNLTETAVLWAFAARYYILIILMRLAVHSVNWLL